VTNSTSGPWSKADALFLIDALARGMSFADVAKFLGRTEDEVRDKRKALSRKNARRVSDDGEID
jgi:hypothetical protein